MVQPLSSLQSKELLETLRLLPARVPHHSFIGKRQPKVTPAFTSTGVDAAAKQVYEDVALAPNALLLDSELLFTSADNKSVAKVGETEFSVALDAFIEQLLQDVGEKSLVEG